MDKSMRVFHIACRLSQRCCPYGLLRFVPFIICVARVRTLNCITLLEKKQQHFQIYVLSNFKVRRRARETSFDCFSFFLRYRQSTYILAPLYRLGYWIICFTCVYYYTCFHEGAPPVKCGKLYTRMWGQQQQLGKNNAAIKIQVVELPI